MSSPLHASSLELLRAAFAAVPDDRFDEPTPCSGWTVAQVMAHAAGDHHPWVSTVGPATPPAYNPFAPPARPEASLDRLITAAIDAATTGWAVVDPVDPVDPVVPTPPPPVPKLSAQLAAAAVPAQPADDATASLLRGTSGPHSDRSVVQLSIRTVSRTFARASFAAALLLVPRRLGLFATTF